ncbi:kinase-like domain-containing protein [Cubamyces lactineus]|nr:kinase-like domain-containing protein [Cubamyces lactineus]
MSAPAQNKPLPRYAYLNEESIERYTRSTLKGNYGLLPSEVWWMERQHYLQEAGYILRPRSRDNDIVAIKTFRKDSQELSIIQHLSSIRHHQNHTVPLIQVLDDPIDPELSLMVMPYLRPCNDPEFTTVGDVVEFINQTLEGLVFMHEQRVAHRDIAVENIMMDAKTLFPDGHHPVRLDYTPDAVYPVSPLPRAGHDIKYYYIDFGLACRFGKENLPYDAFKMDIFALGNLYYTEFAQKYNDMQFLNPIVERMKQRQPDLRPAASDIHAQWIEIRDSLNKASYLAWDHLKKYVI